MVHFGDVAYLHQHLVSNLPREPPSAIPTQSLGFNLTADPVVLKDSERPVSILLFVADASHAASAVEFIRHVPAFHRGANHSSGEYEANNKPSIDCNVIILQTCVTNKVASSESQLATIRALLAKLNGNIFVDPVVPCSELAQREALDRGGESSTASSDNVSGRRSAGKDDKNDSLALSRAALSSLAALSEVSGILGDAAEGALTLLHVARVLQRASPYQNATEAPLLLLACIDDTEPATLAALLGAQIGNTSTVNVCDTKEYSHDVPANVSTLNSAVLLHAARGFSMQTDSLQAFMDAQC